ncbi:palmitoyl-protein thioesterase 1-like protein isoform X1 [Tanacetum coccineum]
MFSSRFPVVWWINAGEIGNGAWIPVSCPCEDQLRIFQISEECMSDHSPKGDNHRLELSRVKNFISVAGPHAGEASIPFCGKGVMCILVDALIKLAIYSDTLQEHLAPANYIKIPTDLDAYREGCKFLPKLNNEFEKNATYKQRFSSLQNLVLIMFDKESVLVPKETSWFGYFPDGAWDPILPAQETRLYKEDWIGLRTLDEAGRVKFINVTGGHLDMADDDMKEYIVPYLVDGETLENPNVTKSSKKGSSASHDSTMGFIRKVGGHQDLQLNVVHRL